MLNKFLLVIFISMFSVLYATPINPSNLKLIALTHSVSISWKDNSDDETGFKIFRDKQLIAVVKSDLTSYVDKGLKSNTTYRYTVKATDDAMVEFHIPSLELDSITNIGILIDSDNNSHTGYTNSNINGADLLIENGKLYKRSENSSTWDRWVELGDIYSMNIVEDALNIMMPSSILAGVELKNNAQVVTFHYENANRIYGKSGKLEWSKLGDDKPIVKKEGVVINEFMASNRNTKIDTDFYEFSDWIELYNNSSNSINVGGYRISTKEGKTGWEIPSDTYIPAQSFLIIWADKESRGLHSNFSLSKKKGSIYLKDREGVIIDNITYKKQKSNISYGRDINSFKWGYMIPTFKSKNSHAYSKDRPSEPVFSMEGGFYNSSVNVKITSPDGGVIYYSIDGSIPNKNSAIYKNELKLNQTTALRAIVYKNGQIPSKVTTKTYFINETSDLPVVSISTNSEYLFDDYIGIYVKGKNGKTVEGHTGNYYQDWYRPVYFEFYDQDSNKELLSKNMKFGISGEASRYWNAKKSFKFKFDGSIDNVFYENKDINKLRDFKLRAGHRGFEIGDVLANMLVEQGHLDVDYQAYRAVNVYVNGELWGEYNIREKKTEKFIVSNYPDVDKNKLDIIKAWDVKAGNEYEHDRMRDFIKSHDLSIDSNYQKAIQMIDVDNFIDYLCVIMYSANDDWVGSNNRIWRERKDGAKWRWMMDDIDRGFQLSNVDKNMFDYVANYHANTLLKDMFNSFMRSSTFRSKFKNRYKELLNTTLSKENILSLANKILSEKESSITKGRFKTDADSFQNYKRAIREFINKRGDVVLRHIDSEL